MADAIAYGAYLRNVQILDRDEFYHDVDFPGNGEEYHYGYQTPVYDPSTGAGYVIFDVDLDARWAGLGLPADQRVGVEPSFDAWVGRINSNAQPPDRPWVRMLVEGVRGVVRQAVAVINGATSANGLYRLQIGYSMPGDSTSQWSGGELIYLRAVAGTIPSQIGGLFTSGMLETYTQNATVGGEGGGVFDFDLQWGDNSLCVMSESRHKYRKGAVGVYTATRPFSTYLTATSATLTTDEENCLITAMFFGRGSAVTLQGAGGIYANPVSVKWFVDGVEITEFESSTNYLNENNYNYPADVYYKNGNGGKIRQQVGFKYPMSDEGKIATVSAYLIDDYGFSSEPITQIVSIPALHPGAQIDALVLADGRVVTSAQDGANIVTRVWMPTAAGLKQLQSSTIANAKLPSLGARRDASLVRTFQSAGGGAISLETSFDGGQSWQ